VTRYRPLYFYLLLLCSCVHSGELVAADKRSAKADIKSVDSLTQLAYSQRGNNVAKALSDLFIAENLANIADYKHGLAVTYLYEGTIFRQSGYEKRALSVFYKSQNIFSNLNDTFNIALVDQEIAGCLLADMKTDEALQLYNQSLGVYQLLGKKKEIANIKNHIGIVFLKQKEPEKAEKLFWESLSISMDISHTEGIEKAYHNLGLLEESRGHYLLADKYYRQSLARDSLLQYVYGTALNQIQLASLSLKQNKPDAAIQLALLAFRNAGSISAINLQKDAARQEVDAYRKKNDFIHATKWQDTLVKIIQNQYDSEKEASLNFIDLIKSQYAKNTNTEKEVERQKQVQKEQLLIITVGTFILIIVAVLAVLALVNYQRQRFFGKELKQKNEIIETNAESLDRLNKEISHQNILLEEDNKTKNKLLSIISHDLRTPLVNTKGVLNLVNQGMVPPEEADRLLQLLETQYLGTTSLLDNLLFWIKGQLQGKDDIKVKVGIYHLMKSLEEEQRIPLIKKKIQIKNHIDKTLSIVIEKEMIRIVCRNLISNAIKFSHENGIIELFSRIENGDTLYLTIKDYGLGMSEETIEKVNAKQYYNTSGTAFEKGSGFGLMLCRDLLGKNNGELIIESSPGKGSSFTIRLPYVTNMEGAMRVG
jgi:signal transduction histidine kinase